MRGYARRVLSLAGVHAPHAELVDALDHVGGINHSQPEPLINISDQVRRDGENSTFTFPTLSHDLFDTSRPISEFGGYVEGSPVDTSARARTPPACRTC